MIKLLNNKDIIVAEQILILQKESYQVEAELIGFMEIPPLLEQLEDILNSEEIFYGYYVEQDLGGIISFTIEKDIIDIWKVAVHPDFFKRGIATKLIRFVEQKEGIKSLIVSTGLKNEPAVKLYTSLGFVNKQVCEVEKGLLVVNFEKKLR